MSARSVKKKRAQKRAASKRSKKHPRPKRSLSARLTPREMTMEELQEAIGPTSSKVAEQTGHDEEIVQAAITAMVESGHVGIADDGTVAPLMPLPEE